MSNVAAALVDEEDLVGAGVADRVPVCGSAGRQRQSVTSALVSSGTRPVTGSPFAGMLPVLRWWCRSAGCSTRSICQRPGGLDLLHSRRRPQVVDDGVRPREAMRADDFLVVDALVLVAGRGAVGGVPLLRDGAEGQVAWHDVSLAMH